MTTKVKHLTRLQTININRRLEEVIKRIDSKHCMYLGDHSDHTVAVEFETTVNSVRGLRQEVFGVTHSRVAIPASGVSPDVIAGLKTQIEYLHKQANGMSTVHNSRTKDFISQMEDVKDRLTTLELENGAWCDAHNLLIDNLVLNQVVQVKHLKIKRGNNQQSMKFPK
jgi:hypothetical protein